MTTFHKVGKVVSIEARPTPAEVRENKGSYRVVVDTGEGSYLRFLTPREFDAMAKEEGV